MKQLREGDGSGLVGEGGRVIAGGFGRMRVTARVSAVDDKGGPPVTTVMVALAHLALRTPDKDEAHATAMALARVVLDLSNDRLRPLDAPCATVAA